MSRTAPHRGSGAPGATRGRMTLAALRRRFWWLGAVPDGSHIVDLRGGVAKVIQTSWVARTARYEAAVTRDFAALGLRVTWMRVRSSDLEDAIRRAHQEAESAASAFDEPAFIARKQQEEEEERARAGTRVEG